ncbi:linear amide C-N hydrolase [Flammeovirga aprica]|uniref:Linear amide C-N hydrolase n=1 Tax=Flammeovirga aprica JL-4 TaxID=694437 RepID=A0A7X9S116_9BACT|nr:linear amide C-N hydrolase [Flammeovirga aprica]NME72187.1 linear amide C-N hydrolase [Flammeovirga aprica JL-4]
MKKSIRISSVLTLCLALLVNSTIFACTGIRLIAEDGSVRYGRTMEWGAFDLFSKVAIVPKNYTFKGLTPEGQNGKEFTSKYGIVGLDMINKDLLVDGMNEAGLAVGLFYFPSTPKYNEFKPENASNTISAQDLVNYLLTQYATIDEIKAELPKIDVVVLLKKQSVLKLTLIGW